MMNANDYQQLAARTECDEEAAMKRGDNLVATRLTHSAFGLSTEVGEFCDALKKWLYYGQPLDKTNIAEELGDLMWYVALACNALDLDLEVVMEVNIRKLRKRYPDKYTDEYALEENRDRDAERTVLEDESGTEIGSTGTIALPVQCGQDFHSADYTYQDTKGHEAKRKSRLEQEGEN